MPVQVSVATGVLVASTAVGGGSAVLFGELGSALITGSFGLVGLLMVSGLRAKNRRLRERVDHLEEQLHRNHSHRKDTDDDG